MQDFVFQTKTVQVNGAELVPLQLRLCPVSSKSALHKLPNQLNSYFFKTMDKHSFIMETRKKLYLKKNKTKTSTNLGSSHGYNQW